MTRKISIIISKTEHERPYHVSVFRATVSYTRPHTASFQISESRLKKLLHFLKVTGFEIDRSYKMFGHYYAVKWE